VYVGGNNVTYNGNEYTAAYWNEGSEPDKNSGPSGSGDPWQSPVACAATSCRPACSGKQCGSDGCGGTCGTCESSETCTAGACEANSPPPSLNVPLDPQLQTQWCWAASAEMIMAYLGTNIQQCAQANYRFNRTDCCTSAASAEGGTECNQSGWPDWSYWGFSFEETAVGSALSFAELQAEFAANRPVGFAWSWTGGGGHYMVATGTEVDANSVEYVNVSDPWLPNVGDEVTLTYDDWVAGPAGVDPTATSSYTHLADDYGITPHN